MKFSLMMALVLIITANAIGQTAKPTIAGTIKEDKSGEIVIGARIGLYNDSLWNGKKPERGAISNKYGFYSIPKVTPGEYYLVVYGVGYQTYMKKINLKSSADLIEDIKIGVKSIKTQEVDVVGQREESPTKSISTISVSPAMITKMPAIGGETDVFRALQLLPGVKQASEISSGLYVRGGSPDQNLILLDGVIVYNPSHLGGFLSAFNNDALRDVNLIKGAFPAEYGGRMSSVLDMTMKEGTKEKFSGTGGISLITSRLTVEGPINENSTFMISGRRMYLDLITGLFARGAQIPQYYFYDLNAKVNYQISNSDRLFMSGYFGRDVLNSPGNQRTNFNIDWGNATGNLRWMHIISPSLFTNFSFILTNYNFQTDLQDTANTASNFSSLSKIQDYMFRGEVQYFPSKEHTLKAGGEITKHTFSVDASTEVLNTIRININPNTVINTLDAALYAQDEWLITPSLASNIGGRLYYFQEGNYLNFEPRFSLSYALSDRTSLKGSVALAHQFLHLIVRNDISLPTDLWFPSTANIKPSKAWQETLGIETKLGDDGEYLASLEIYYKKMDNLYEYKDSAQFAFGIPLETQFTSGWGESYGGEIFINKRIGAFTGWIGYTLSWTKRYFADLNNGQPFYPRYDIRHDISVVTTFEINKRWEVGASWVFYSGQTFTVPTAGLDFAPIGWGSQVGDGTPYSSRDKQKYIYTERDGYRMEPYHKLDANLMYKFQWFDLPFQLSIDIYNVYSRLNPFAMYIDYTTDAKGNVTSKVYKQITLFPFIPTFGLSFKF